MGNIRQLLEISLLYFLQGVPYGMQTKYIPLIMRRRGIDLSTIGLSNLISLPWILKFSWANFFDRFANTGREWVVACLCLLSFCSLFLDINSSSSLFLLPLIFMNFFSASLDIAVDALAIKRFDAKDLGYCNICHVVGYKIGILFAGGFLTALSHYISLPQFIYFQSLVYGLAAIYFAKRSDLFHSNSGLKSKHNHQNNPQSTSWKAFSILIAREQLWILVFVFFYKMGEQGFSSIYPLYLIDNSLSLSRVGMVTGIFGQLFSIFGSSMGGILISKFRMEVNHLLFLVACSRSIVLILYSVFLVIITRNLALHIVVESVFQLLAGTMTTATFTAMMMMSKRLPDNIHALHYTLMATFEVLGKLLLKLFAGLITEYVGYANFFAICCAMELFVLFLTSVNVSSKHIEKSSVVEPHQKEH